MSNEGSGSQPTTKPADISVVPTLHPTQHRSNMTFEVLPKRYYPEWGFRPGTPCFPLAMHFVLMNGGMGDYITWLRPIQWLAECATWITGTAIMPDYLRELGEYFLRPYPEWKVRTYTDMKEAHHSDGTPFRGPVELQRESLNATGAHLSTCGWVYFTNKERAPDGTDKVGVPWDSYPRLLAADLLKVPVPGELLGIGKYAVLTTGITTNSRKIPGNYWNPIIAHIRAKGLTPVFLGKSVVETGNPMNIHTKWDEAVRIDLGLDLRNKTTLLQAAAIMSRAECVIGHDNGLLHLAGCTEVPIVFGYNLASPDHREPKRPVGKTYNVILEPSELACNFCQSKTNFVIGYNFRSCFYGDNLCIDMLFKNEGARWKKQIDLALGGKE